MSFHVDRQNTVILHAAFEGHTAAEVYFGQGLKLEAELLEARRRARAARMIAKTALACEECVGREPPSQVASCEAA